MADDESNKAQGSDTVIFGPQVGQNSYLYLRQRADNTIQAGVASSLLQDGRDEALNHCDGIFRVSGDGPVYNVEAVWERDTQTQHYGPAMVSTVPYRSGWDRIFGGKQTVGKA